MTFPPHGNGPNRAQNSIGVSISEAGGSLKSTVASRAEAIAKHRLFDHREAPLVDAALASVHRHSPDDARVLFDLVDRLTVLSQLLASIPSLRVDRQLALDARSEETLVEHLTGIDGLSNDLELPFKATLSRTFLLAKIQFLRGLVKTTELRREPEHRFAELCYQLREEFAQSVYTLLAEEILLALLRKENVDKETKRRAADQLITIWDNAELEIDEFCPLLESAWHARNRVTSGLGSLLGTMEYFRLIAEDCAPQFLDFFARDEVAACENQAFQEFLFNITYEEFKHLNEAMGRDGLEVITPEWATGILGRPIERLGDLDAIDPMALYRSYYRRQLAADFRNMAGSPGPGRTAEAYMMIYLLNQQE